MRKSIENLSKRKYTGGRKVAMRGRRKFELDRYPNEAVLGDNHTKTRNVRGNNRKTALKFGALLTLLTLYLKKPLTLKYCKLLGTLPIRTTKEEELLARVHYWKRILVWQR
jgi:small subunit ribosomal protein S8e